MDLKGKCAIVTGGSSGIGKAIANELARRGANIFLIARREDVLKAAVKEIEKSAVMQSQRFGFFSADVADSKAVQEAVNAAESACGPPAVLINSAGVSRAGYVEKLPISGMEQEIRVNYLGTVFMIKAVLDGMMSRREGWILNVSSLAGLKGIFGYTGYSGSKFAVVGFSESLRSELRPYGVNVSVLCPPDVDTPMLVDDKRDKPLETLKISEGAEIMQPEDVARAALAGLEKGRFIIIPNFAGKMLWIANRIAPSLVDRIMNSTIDKVRKERGL
ncbi:MAG: SDR family NAD(P)-dependent oxidoreductase [Candidatus Abyssobacteria bacterium SURF_17]|uniref:3-dehydrosphinganine reductase n=1 Tax=Candidatus Abyssobacteria bacterium SURF_17 TaxID=2093361 RepID=A0A419F0C9_9BACT|nr:MAG: SDR family NAD(P)-dependent oxidoreductase [Candidatus Abyssubacteria bacterium SURF_17]